MAVFDRIRSLIAAAPAGTKPVVVCIPHPNSGSPLHFGSAETVRFFDDQGVVEAEAGPHCLFFAVANIQRLSVLYVEGSLGAQIEKDMPDVWNAMNDEGRKAMAGTFL
jgi:hypothetical protein